MSDNRIQTIVIVGGGTAGWMAAAALSQWLKNKAVKISLVESDALGTVGVGEATVPGIHRFNQSLELKEYEFIKATQATFKLGIEFKDWFKQGVSFFHPFAIYGLPIEGQAFYQCWLKLHKAGYEVPLDEFCLASQMAYKNRFAQPDSNPTTPLAHYSYAYHFDASLYAKFLRSYAEARGVIRTEGKISQVNLNNKNGFIDSVGLENGAVIKGDLFIDCSGFKGLLIEETLKTGFEDWSHWLPCDGAVAMQTANVDAPTPYTKSIAQAAGWQWKIPLQHRSGNGYVYCSQYISDQEAIDTLTRQAEGEVLTQPRIIKFTTGVRKKFWHKNCVALGLASGFLEPLESTSISLIQTGIEKLIQFMPDLTIDPVKVEQANRLNVLEYERIRDFIILHYKSNQRTDSRFWQSVREMSIPESLSNKIAAFKRDGSLIHYEQESFLDASWISMYNGFQILPEKYNASVHNMNNIDLKNILEKIRKAIQLGVEHAPSHAQFLSEMN